MKGAHFQHGTLHIGKSVELTNYAHHLLRLVQSRLILLHARLEPSVEQFLIDLNSLLFILSLLLAFNLVVLYLLSAYSELLEHLLHPLTPVIELALEGPFEAFAESHHVQDYGGGGTLPLAFL